MTHTPGSLQSLHLRYFVSVQMPKLQAVGFHFVLAASSLLLASTACPALHAWEMEWMVVVVEGGGWPNSQCGTMNCIT